jgi:hypothetical protein
MVILCVTALFIRYQEVEAVAVRCNEKRMDAKAAQERSDIVFLCA